QTLGRRYPNAYVEIPIMTPLPPITADWRKIPGRNLVNVLSVDAAIALHGNEGTHNELDMMAEYLGEAQRAPEHRRTVLFGPAEAFTERHRALFVRAATLAEAEAHLRRVLAARNLALGNRS